MSPTTFQPLVYRLLRRGCGHRIAVGLATAVLALPLTAAPKSQLQDFEAAGPVRLAQNQVLAVCVANFEGETSNVLLAIVDATSGAGTRGVLVSQQVQLAPYQSACLYLPGANQEAQASVIGMVVDNGSVEQGVIRQGFHNGGISGGGCVASVQVLDANTGRTISLTQTLPHRVR